MLVDEKMENDTSVKRSNLFKDVFVQITAPFFPLYTETIQIYFKEKENAMSEFRIPVPFLTNCITWYEKRSRLNQNEYPIE